MQKLAQFVFEFNISDHLSPHTNTPPPFWQDDFIYNLKESLEFYINSTFLTKVIHLSVSLSCNYFLQ